jgi:hypothetical protein
MTAAGAVLAVALLTFAALPPAGAGLDFTEGSANAEATVAGLNIPYGGANIGLLAGDATASYFDNTARASAITVDPGFLRLGETFKVCGAGFPIPLPVPTAADTNAAGQRPDAHTNSKGPGLGSESASAQPGSHADGRATSGAFGLPGILELAGGTATSDARLDTKAESRTVTADVAEGALTLLGGLVKLGGLHWSLRQVAVGADNRSAKATETSSFVLGSIALAGVPLPTATAAQVASSIAIVNQATGPFGLRIRLPAVVRHGNGYDVTPLTVALGGKTGYGPLLYPLLAGPGNTSLVNLFNSLTEPAVFDPTNCNELLGLLKQSPQLNELVNTVGLYTPIILSAFAASLNGGAELDLDIGGVRTNYDDTYYAPRSVPPALVPLTRTTPALAAVAPVAAPTATPATPASTAIVAAPASQTRSACATTSPVGRPGCWSGAARLAATLGGIVTLGLLATDELWRRRRLQRAEEPAR